MKGRKGLSTLLSAGAICLLVLVLILNAIPTALADWSFNNSFAVNNNVEVHRDIINYNIHRNDEIVADEPQTYDVYFMAQHIDIEDFLIPANGEKYRFTSNADGHDLYYTRESDHITSYESRLGWWGDTAWNATTANSTSLYKKFENKTHLTGADVEGLGIPNFMLCDNGGYGMTFIGWVMDPIYIDYGTAGRANQGGYFNPNQHAELNHQTIYYREGLYDETNNNRLKIWGTYPDSDFSISRITTLLTNYDDRAFDILGSDGEYHKSIFVYPVYSLGKDLTINSRKWYERSLDCMRLRTNNTRVDSNNDTDMHPIYDSDVTNALHNETSMSDHIVMWGQANGFERYAREYFCFRYQDREVTPEMKAMNELAAATTEEATDQYTAKFLNLSPVQRTQVTLGEYFFMDIAFNRKNWNGTQIGYLLDSDGELVDFNYKEGLFNIYIFVKSSFVDDSPVGEGANDFNSRPEEYAGLYNYRDPSFYDEYLCFNDNEIAEINALFASRNINVDRTVECQLWDYYFKYNTSGSWGNELRAYYVVFEEIVNLVSCDNYDDPESMAFDYIPDISTGNMFTTGQELYVDLDDYVDRTTNTAIKDLNDNPIALTYPSYYHFMEMETERGKKIKTNIAYGEHSANYNVPIYQYHVGANELVTKEYKGPAYLEFMYEAVARSEEKREEISVTLADGVTTYTLNELMVADPTLYASVLSQLESVYIYAPKESGTYRFAAILYKYNGEYEIDIWAASPVGFIVTVYDASRHVDDPLVPDVYGSLITRANALSHTSFLGNISYHEGDLLRVGNPTNTTVVNFLVETDDSDVDAYAVDYHRRRIITFDNMLEYYASKGKCLYVESTGRYITKENILLNPQYVYGDMILFVVDIPASMVVADIDE